MSSLGRINNFLSGTRVDASTPPPYLLRFRSSKLFILSTLCTAVFTDVFLYGIIVPVMPFALTARAGVSQGEVQKWVSVLLAVYGAALLAGSPLAGWYADRSSSRRLPLLFGLLALAGSTVLLCLARTIALLVVGRLLQGFSAAVVWTVGIALLVDTVGQKEIGQTLGYVSLSMSLGILLAPLLGGIVYNKAGYYAVYYMAFGLIFLDIILRLCLIEKKIARQWDVDEATDSEGRPGSDTTEVDEGKGGAGPGESSPEPIHGQDYQPPTEPPDFKPTLPPVFTLLASRRLLTALWGCVVQGSLMTSFDSTVPLFVQREFHWDSTGAGLVFLAIMIPSFIAPAVGWISDRHGPRWLCVGGFIFAIPCWVLLKFVDHDSIRQKVLFCALLALIGVSLTLVNPPLMAEITYVVEAKEKERPGRYGKTSAYATAYGWFVASFAAGTLIGPLWSGYVENSAGWGTMAWSLGLLSFFGAIPCLIYTGGYIMDRNAKSGDERAVGKSALTPQNEASGTV